MLGRLTYLNPAEVSVMKMVTTAPMMAVAPIPAVVQCVFEELVEEPPARRTLQAGL
jgi:hypothetical protein